MPFEGLMVQGHLATFVLGMGGALAPEILRLYTIRQRPSEFTWSGFYVVVSLAFASLGGLVAVILPATTWWAAFYAGVSTPVLIGKAIERTSYLTNPKTKASGLDRLPQSRLWSFVKGL